MRNMWAVLHSFQSNTQRILLKAFYSNNICCRNEIHKIAYSSYVRGFYMSSMVYLERSTLFATLLSYVLLGNAITPSKVITEIHSQTCGEEASN
jgi:hypothetical protein